ncbi:MAG: DUF4097 family beta strand repeat-containing protein [Bacteroidota bacterium]
MKNVITAVFLLVLGSGAVAQSETMKIEKSFDISDPGSFHLEIENICGDVTVSGYDGPSVEVSVEISMTEKRSGGLEEAREDLTLGEFELENGLLLTMEAPWIERKWKNGRVWSKNFYREPKSYDYQYTFLVRVPKGISVSASTVNKGDVFIEQVEGALWVRNVNGHIEVRGAHDVNEATTVNGDITIQYTKNQSSDARFHTINGDIILQLLKGWSGEVEAYSMNGEVFTAFDYRVLPAKVERRQEKKNGGTVYKIDQKKSVAIGTGVGPRLEFETLNGNIYLKRI